MPVFKLDFGVSFLEAIAAAERREAILPDDFYDELPDRLRQYAFTASGLSSLDQVRAVLDSLNAKLAEGESFQAWKKEALAADWSIPKTKLELISRMHAQTAYMAGHWSNFVAQQKTRPFLMYSAINDSRTRPAHRAMSGYIAPVGDPIWNLWSPPCGYNCRCSLISLTPAQAQQRGVGHQSLPNLRPDPGFGQKPLEDAGAGLQQLAMQRAKDAGPQFVTALEALLERGYAVPPLRPEEAAFANELRDQLRTLFGEVYDALSDAELYGLRQYATDSFPINAYLRDLLGDIADEGKRDAIMVQSALRKLADDVERVTFRGARPDALFDRAVEELTVGKVIRMRTFTSTTSSELIAQDFGDRYFFTIRGRSAVNVDGFYHVEGENEFLFPAGTNFRVVRMTDEGGILHIELEETDARADMLFSANDGDGR